MKILLKTLLNLALLLLATTGVAYAEVAGHVQFVHGVVQLTTPAGQVKVIRKGDAVSEGDMLASAQAATAQIKMRDGGLLALRADTQLKIDSYKFNGQQDGSEQSFFSLLKGGFRAVTGLIGQTNKSSYRISTPASTIGIRGTDHEVVVVAPDSRLAAVAPTGTYDRVNVGETSMTTRAGFIAILPNQMGFVAAADQLPQLQPVNPAIFTAMPPPLTQAGQGLTLRASVVDNALLPLDTGVGYSLPANANFVLRPITATVTVPPLIVTANPNGGISIITF